jgi:flagellar motor switch protein FliN
MSNLSQTRRRDAHEVMAEIFNNFGRQTETRFLTALEEDNRESAERIKTLMFTSAVLGRARMEINDLLKIGPGTVLELDRKVGEAIDIYVNNRLVARGEVVLVEEKLGVTMTEIIKAERG